MVFLIVCSRKTIYINADNMQGFEGLKMKEKVTALCCLILVLLISTPAIIPAQAKITGWIWVSPVFAGSEPFFGVNAVAYKEGSTARLVLSVDRNDPFVNLLNVSAVIVSFDWGVNYTSPEASPASPVQLNADRTIYAFTIAFTVPSIAVASNLIPHTYTVYVEYVNATTGPKEKVGTFIDIPNHGFPDIDPYFAIYSTDQAESQEYRQSADAYTKPVGGFSSAEAEVFWLKGDAEVSRGEASYSVGDFASARTSYQNAITFFEEAYTTEATYSQDYREAQTNYYNALASAAGKEADAAMKEADAQAVEANATKIEADAAIKQAEAALAQADADLTNAYGWLAFGIGWILIGIGTIVYGLRRPKPPA